MKNAKHFFSREINLSTLDFPHYIQVISTFPHPLYTFFHKKYYLYPKLRRKMQKTLLNSSPFACCRIKSLLHSTYLLQSEFKTIIRTLCKQN